MVIVHFINGQKAEVRDAKSVEDRTMFGEGLKGGLICLDEEKQIVGRFRWDQIIGFDIEEDTSHVIA